MGRKATGDTTMKSLRFVFASLFVLSLVLCSCSKQGNDASSMEQWGKDLTAAWNSHDVEKILSFYTEDVVYEDVAMAKINHGKDELRAFIKEFFAFAPDFKLELKSIIVSGDRFCIEGIFGGTFQPTGKSFSIRGATVGELRDGKIKRNSDYYDGSSLMGQSGVQSQTAAADPFVGTWKFNVAKSKGSKSSMAKSSVMKTELQGDVYKNTWDGVDAQGKSFHVEWSAKYDGRDYPVTGNPNVDMASSKWIDANSFSHVQKKAGKEVGTWRVTVSKDGRALISTGKGKDSKGQEYNATDVLEKQ
jgi:steroid delta-isomerase-like uncharacterized protein